MTDTDTEIQELEASRANIERAIRAAQRRAVDEPAAAADIDELRANKGSVEDRIAGLRLRRQEEAEEDKRCTAAAELETRKHIHGEGHRTFDNRGRRTKRAIQYGKRLEEELVAIEEEHRELLLKLPEEIRKEVREAFPPEFRPLRQLLSAALIASGAVLPMEFVDARALANQYDLLEVETRRIARGRAALDGLIGKQSDG